MARPFVVPANWQHQDWDDCCAACHQPHFLVMLAEARLPSAARAVTRCSGCKRALWYRSNATPITIADYAETVTVWATLQLYSHKAKRSRASKGVRTKKKEAS